MPETAIKFGSYEAAKRAFANFEGHGDSTRISSYSKFTAGGVAGMVAQYVTPCGFRLFFILWLGCVVS